MVSWENCDRPPYELYIETNDEFAQDLFLDPLAILFACAIPATRYGEGTVFIDFEIFSELRDRLPVAMSWLCHWYRAGSQADPN